MQGTRVFFAAENMDPLVLIIIFVFAVVALYLRSPTVKGARGERKVHGVLAKRLEDEGYFVIHDITLSIGADTTQIDHIVVSRFGIFVIETKNYRGWIFGDQRSKQWTQVIYGKKTRFQNPLRQNYKHTKAVESFLGVPSSRVHSVVVFVGDSKFKTLMPPNVTTLSGLIPFMRTKTDRVLSERRVGALANQLREAKSGVTGTRNETPVLRSVSSNPMCPKCGSEMVLRTGRKGKNVGKQFWDCSRFPKCRAVKHAT